jgi:AraC family transcriptional activator of pobA
MDARRENLYFSVMRKAATMPRDSRPASAIPVFLLYGEPPTRPDEATVHIETIASRSALHDWAIGAHRHRELHQLLVLLRGGVDLRLDEHRDSLRAPAVLIVPPGTVHAFRFSRNTRGLVISFAHGLARGLSRAGSGIAAGVSAVLERPAALALTRAEFDATDIRAVGELLLKEFARSAPGRTAAMHGLLGALVANVLRVAERPGEPSDGTAARDRELVARFRQLIERHHRDNLGVAAYTRELEVSPSRLRRACLAAAGQPPIALVHQRRLVEAERQLRYTTMSVAQIAYYLGFDDPAYFTRFFTRGANLSPRAFRLRDGGSNSTGTHLTHSRGTHLT